MRTPPSRSDLILHQLILAAEVPGCMPVVHPQHRVTDGGAQVSGHALLPVGPDVLVLTCQGGEATNTSVSG